MKKVSERTIITVLICIVIVAALFFLNYYLVDTIKRDSIRILCSTLISTAETVLLANILWEAIAKENFAKTLLDLVKLKGNIDETGIEEVYHSFNSINWSELFRSTKNFTGVFIYAYSWRSHNREVIQEFAKKRGRVLTIIVPNPNNEDVMAALDNRFGFEGGKTKEKIEECISDFQQIGAKVMVYNGTLQSSYYLMDKRCVMAVFPHSKTKESVPAIKAKKGGHLYGFVEKDIHAIIEQSERLK